MKFAKKVLLIVLIEALIFSPMLEIKAQEASDRVEKSGGEERFVSQGETDGEKELEAENKESKERAKELAKQKWTREKWLEESSCSQGLSSRTSGALLGFTLGATAGMLIGKGFQGRKVEREVYHRGRGWDDPSWTEVFYSYEHRNAPLYGATIGGVAGGMIGYYVGRSADKQYYTLVPRNIRMAHTRTSGFGNFLFGFGFVGVITGVIAGNSLYAPMSDRKGELKFNVGACVGGYLIGSIFGTTAIAGFKNRAKHMQLWERSLEFGNPQSSLGVQFVPLDFTAVRVHPYRSENGRIQCEYSLDLIRVNL